MLTDINIPTIGLLRTIDVFDYYDRPVLFSCGVITGSFYIAVLVADDSSSEKWLLAPISKLRLDSVRAGKINLNSVFAHAELGFVHAVSVIRDSSQVEVSTILCDALDSELLPSAESYASPIESEHPRKRWLTQVQDMAQQLLSPAVAVRLDFASTTGFRAPAGSLGKVLTSFQAYITAAAQSATDSPLAFIKAKFLRPEHELAIVGTFEGSFGVAMAPSDSAAKPANDALTKALALLGRTLDASLDAETLRKSVGIDPRIGSRYKELIRKLHSAQAGVSIEWTSADLKYNGQHALSQQQIREVHKLLKKIPDPTKKQITINAQLVGMNIRSKVFELKDLATRENLKGKIRFEKYDSMERLEINAKYDAVIDWTVEIDPITEEESNKYVLREMHPSKPKVSETDPWLETD